MVSFSSLLLPLWVGAVLLSGSVVQLKVEAIGPDDSAQVSQQTRNHQVQVDESPKQFDKEFLSSIFDFENKRLQSGWSLEGPDGNNDLQPQPLPAGVVECNADPQCQSSMRDPQAICLNHRCAVPAEHANEWNKDHRLVEQRKRDGCPPCGQSCLQHCANPSTCANRRLIHQSNHAHTHQVNINDAELDMGADEAEIDSVSVVAAGKCNCPRTSVCHCDNMPWRIWCRQTHCRNTPHCYQLFPRFNSLGGLHYSQQNHRCYWVPFESE